MKGGLENRESHVEMLGDRPPYYGEKGLRTDGDDENHEVEPPVSSHPLRCIPLLPPHRLSITDVFSSDYELGSNGISMDRQSDSSLHLR